MSFSFHPEYSPVLRYPAAIDLLRPPHLGIDFEWDIRSNLPTILGVSDGNTTVSVPFEDGFPFFRSLLDRFPGAFQFIGHNAIRSERPILARYGIDTPLTSWQDTIVWHYLTSAHLCKAGGKALGDGAENERRGPGFMNIWTMCSSWTSEPCWKFCRDAMCQFPEPHPCPEHNPFWYNGLDARNPVLALPGMIRKAKLINVDHLYPLHAQLMEQFQKMQERGVWVNLDYINKLRSDFAETKARLWSKGQKLPTELSLPFNPNSGPQVQRFFKEKYDFKLDDNTEDTIREAVEDRPEIKELQDLLAYKESGSGPDRWFAPKRWEKDDWVGYVVEQGGGLGTIHANVNFFTSTSRTACSNPNMQNVEKRRIDRHTGEKVGERLRAAIVAPPGYRLYSADQSNGENRVVLYFAGYQIPRDRDLHDEMVANMGIKKDDEFAIKLGGPRDASKSVTHAGDYMEGLQLKTTDQLRSGRIQAEIRAGARIVYPDWKFRDKVVTFTGANLAKRAWGDASFSNRRKANEAMERYLGESGAFPGIRDWQRRVAKELEKTGAVQVPEGYYMLSVERTPEDALKAAAAMWGQCLDGSTLILKADLSWARQDALKIGDELVGIEEAPRASKKKRRLRISIVEGLEETILPSYRLITDKGSIIASREHLWLTRNERSHASGGLQWLRTDSLKEGWDISFLASPWIVDDSYEAGYLAAAYDGEGSVERLSFYQRPNMMLQKVRDFLLQKGFHPYPLKDGNGGFRGSKNDVIRLILPTLQERIRAAGMFRLKRIDTRKLWDGINPNSGKNGYERAKVLGLEYLGPRKLVAMQTSTRTFVAEGMFSHNSPVAHRLKVSLLNLENHPRTVPILPVHDEHLVLVRDEYSPEQAKKWIQEAMEVETKGEPGLIVPVKVKVGQNWKEMKKL